MTSPSSGSNNSRQGNVTSTPIAPNPEEVNEFHRYSDVDTSPDAQHHTLGTDGSQASPGNHNHDGRNSAPVAIDPLALEGAWITPTLNAGYTQNTAGFQTLQYRRVGNRLDLRGSFQGPLGDVFTLPVNFRPAKAHAWAGATEGSPYGARMELYTDGRVRFQGGTGGAAGITFVTTSLWID